jgi:mono/diheme cytochrome c family protein
MFNRFSVLKFFAATALIALFAIPVLAQEAQEAEQKDAKKLFANSCSWFHGNFCMKAGKGGPKLAGITKDEESIYNTLIKGQGAMPSFKNTLKPEEIRLLARYIKSLPNE